VLSFPSSPACLLLSPLPLLLLLLLLSPSFSALGDETLSLYEKEAVISRGTCLTHTLSNIVEVVVPELILARI
jgi:hypothetical protein